MDKRDQFASFSSLLGRDGSCRALRAFIVCVVTLALNVGIAAAQGFATNSEQGTVVRQEPGRQSSGLTMSGEPIQTFADGNRIVRRTNTLLYRDSRGRTRREVVLGDVAGIVVAGNPLRIITIHDPDSGTTTVFDPDRRLMQIGTATGGAPPPPPVGSQEQATQPVGAAEREESLGTRTIEGLVCEGSRKTTTIPAGAIGNDRPMTTVTERWLSRELQILVLSRVSDPRFGETTYRLTKITRVEPTDSLFKSAR
jgi:hypothetical protein